VALSWQIIASKDVDRFEVERSTDNNTYIKTGTVAGTVKLYQQQNFLFNDDVAGINKELIYYRIKVIDKTGNTQYSNILVVHLQKISPQVNIMPNPAFDRISVVYFSESGTQLTLHLVNSSGVIVLMQDMKVVKGNNVLQLSGLSQYQPGIYSLQLIGNGNTITKKIILIR
jgi:hypothetical protein